MNHSTTKLQNKYAKFLLKYYHHPDITFIPAFVAFNDFFHSYHFILRKDEDTQRYALFSTSNPSSSSILPEQALSQLLQVIQFHRYATEDGLIIQYEFAALTENGGILEQAEQQLLEIEDQKLIAQLDVLSKQSFIVTDILLQFQSFGYRSNSAVANSMAFLSTYYSLIALILSCFPDNQLPFRMKLGVGTMIVLYVSFLEHPQIQSVVQDIKERHQRLFNNFCYKVTWRFLCLLLLIKFLSYLQNLG